jgi:hypothetical protein
MVLPNQRTAGGGADLLEGFFESVEARAIFQPTHPARWAPLLIEGIPDGVGLKKSPLERGGAVRRGVEVFRQKKTAANTHPTIATRIAPT